MSVEMENNDYYLAESYQNLARVGDVYEKDGKEYIDVILKSGKTHAARVYRPKSDREVSTKTRHIIYNLRNELGFAPGGFINVVRCKDESELKGICHFHPAFGAYLKCQEDLSELPWEKGLDIQLKSLEWWEIVDDKDHLLPIREIRKRVDERFPSENS